MSEYSPAITLLLEIRLYVLSALILGTPWFMYRIASRYLRFRDIDATTRMTVESAGDLLTPFLFMGFGMGKNYLSKEQMLVLFGAMAVCAVAGIVYAVRTSVPKPVPERRAEAELEERIAKLNLKVNKLPPKVWIVSSEMLPDLLYGGTWNLSSSVLIPEKFADSASDDEMLALAARQVASRSYRCAILPLIPAVAGSVVLPLALNALGKSDSFGDLALLATGLAGVALSFLLWPHALRDEDVLRDRAAVSLTGNPRVYLSAMELAAKLAPAEQKWPWWFRPVSLQARRQAIQRA